MGYVIKRTHETRRCCDCGNPVEVRVGIKCWVTCHRCAEWLFFGTVMFNRDKATEVFE